MVFLAVRICTQYAIQVVCILEKFAYEWENAAANATLSLPPDFHLVKRDFWRLSSQRAFLETKNVQKFL